LKKYNWFFIPLVFLITVLAGFFWWRWATTASNTKCKMENVKCGEKTFIIKKRESLSSVAERLQKENLIRSSLAFKILVLNESLSGKIQAGSFHLNSSQSPQEIANILTHGTEDIWLTFPEGWRKEEFAQRLVANLTNFDSDGFLRLATNYEGELFPDTYLLPKQASASAVFNLLFNNFQKKFDKQMEETLLKSDLTKKEALILASLVERETKNDQDRSIVAGILIKRLKKDWSLQVDAALQYVVASARCKVQDIKCEWWRPVEKEDLKINSPYNTYKYKGLPPTPICNPGLASLKAVIDPQETDFWFYLSDEKGKMHYAKTIEEHNENIKLYLKSLIRVDKIYFLC